MLLCVRWIHLLPSFLPYPPLLSSPSPPLGGEEEEDMRRREDELREELNMATLRCEELKRTLLTTKSFIDPKVAVLPQKRLFLTLQLPSSHSTLLSTSTIKEPYFHFTR